MLGFVALVLTAQTAFAQDVIRLPGQPMVLNTIGAGMPNSVGTFLLKNGTTGAYVNGAVGSTIGPLHVIRKANGDYTVTGHVHVGLLPKRNESDANVTSTGNESQATINIGQLANAATGNQHTQELSMNTTSNMTNPATEVATLVDKGLSFDKLGNYTGAILYYDEALANEVLP